MFGSNHSVRNTLGVAAVSGVALFSAFSAAGQQVANLDAERQSYLTTQCGHIPDAVRRVGCNAEAGLRFDERRIVENQKSIAASQKTIADAQRETECANQLTAGARAGDARFSPERGRAVLNGKPLREFGYCNLRDALTKS